jgi:ubiquinone biosynthesis protein
VFKSLFVNARMERVRSPLSKLPPMSQQLPSHHPQHGARMTSLTPVKGLLGKSRRPSPPTLPMAAALAPVAGVRGIESRWALLRGLAGIWFKLTFVRLVRPAQLDATGRAVATRLASFDGFWPDLAQLLARCHGFFPSAVSAQIASHCHPSPALTLAEVDAAVRQDFGLSIPQLFVRFDAIPVRVGRYADTYRARLRIEQVEVDVRVQRPGLRPRLERDLAVLKIISAFMARIKGRRQTLFNDVIGGYAERVPALSDLRYEASAMRRMRDSLEEHKVAVPKLFRRHVGRQVLVQEHFAAPTLQQWLDWRAHDPVAAGAWLRTNDIDLDLVGRRVFRSILRQICEDNFFNRNMVPSNIVLLRDSRFGLLSCEATASLDKRFLNIFNMSMAALANDAYEKFVDTLFLLCTSLPVSDLGAVRSELVRMVRAHAARAQLDTLDHREKSLSLLTARIATVLSSNGIVLDAQMLKLIEAMGNADQVVSLCCPRINQRTELTRYAKKASARKLSEVFSGGIKKAVSDIVTPLSEMVRFETASVRKKAQSFRASAGKMAYVGATVAKWAGRGLIAAAVYGVWVYLHQHHIDVLAPFHATAASEHAQNVEHLQVSTWILIFVGLAALVPATRAIARRLGQEEAAVIRSNA